MFFFRFPRRRQESTGRATVVVDLTESDDGRSKVKKVNIQSSWKLIGWIVYVQCHVFFQMWLCTVIHLFHYCFPWGKALGNCNLRSVSPGFSLILMGSWLTFPQEAMEWVFYYRSNQPYNLPPKKVFAILKSCECHLVKNILFTWMLEYRNDSWNKQQFILWLVITTTFSWY